VFATGSGAQKDSMGYKESQWEEKVEIHGLVIILRENKK
jgi:hypothetical protein